MAKHVRLLTEVLHERLGEAYRAGFHDGLDRALYSRGYWLGPTSRAIVDLDHELTGALHQIKRISTEVERVYALHQPQPITVESLPLGRDFRGQVCAECHASWPCEPWRLCETVAPLLDLH